MSRRRIGYALLLGTVLMCVSGIMATAQSTMTLPTIYLPYISIPPPFQIVFISDRDGNSEIYVMNEDGSNQIRLTNNPAPEDSYSPAWSPDGTKISFYKSDGQSSEYYVMNADGSNQRVLRGWPVWSPDGSKLVVVSREDVPGTDEVLEWIYLTDPDSGDEFLLAQGGQPAWSPDGGKIAFTSGEIIWAMNADGGYQTRLTDNLESAGNPDWSPDGCQIAFSSGYNIWVMNADGGNQTQLNDSPESDCCPRWSPNGSKILFSRYIPIPYPYEANGFFTGTMNPDGSEQFITLGGGAEWSPDGTKLLFWCGGRMSDAFCVSNADGSDTIGLGGGQYTTWSPDGKKIAYVVGGTGAPWLPPGDAEIYVMDADGSNETTLTDNETNDFAPVWSPVRRP